MAMESEHGKQDVKQRQERVLELVKQLDEARSQIQVHQDERVEKVKSELLKEFQISPETWVSKDKSLEELISKLEAHHKEINAALQTKENLSDSSLLCKASGGRALKGIFLTKNIEDQIEDRAIVLKPPEEVQLGGGSNSDYVHKQFSTKEDENAYRKYVDVLGGNFSTSFKAPVYKGTTVGAGMAHTDKTERRETFEDHQKFMFSSTVKHFSVQLASFSFNSRDLRLCDFDSLSW